MSTYDKVVAENLEHMQTSAAEWSAVGMIRMAETTDAPDGRPMPEFAFPEDYDKAPTLHPTGNMAENMCCELCGHPIKNAYWIQNDKRRWVLMVGSECVTHFEGKSGERIVKETVWAANREIMKGYQDATLAFEKEWMTVRPGTKWSVNGYATVNVRGWKHNTPKGALKAHLWLDNVTANIAVEPYKQFGQMQDATTNGVITRWMKLNRAEADKCMEAIQAALPSKGN